MSDQSQREVDELLDRYVDALEAGQPISPESLCGEDTALLATLKSRIRDYFRADQALGAPARVVAPQTSDDHSDAHVGAVLKNGRYQLVELLGAGGMGRVFRAVDKELNDLPVAVKLVGYRDKLGADLFAHEVANLIRVTREIGNECAVRILDQGRTEDGVPFFVSEYISGLTLRRVIEELAGHGALSQPDIAGRLIRANSLEHFALSAHVIGRIAGCVHEMHELGLCHKDIKPDNIILQPRGAGRVLASAPPWIPRLVDFGITTSSDRSTVARRLQGAMTPAYAPPEGLAGTFDPSTDQARRAYDVWCLGATLEELCLLARRDFLAPPRDYNDSLPATLRAVLGRALAPRPEDRYATASQMATDLSEAARQLAPAFWTPSRTVGAGISRRVAATLLIGAVLVSFFFPWYWLGHSVEIPDVGDMSSDLRITTRPAEMVVVWMYLEYANAPTGSALPLLTIVLLVALWSHRVLRDRLGVEPLELATCGAIYNLVVSVAFVILNRPSAGAYAPGDVPTARVGLGWGLFTLASAGLLVLGAPRLLSRALRLVTRGRVR